MAFPTQLKQLCTPAYLYFILSVIGLVLAAFQNMGNRYHYVLGGYICRVPSCIGVFLVKIIYVLFWTWVLNLMCKDGHGEIAWLLVLFPFVLLFLVVALVMHEQRKDKKSKENA